MTFQAKLTTKLKKYSVDDTIIELKNTVDENELNIIVKNLLLQLNKFDDQSNESKQLEEKKFDFLVGGRILRLNVEQHLELYSDDFDSKEILNEKLVEIEYLLSLEAPKPLDQIPQDDWISCLDANDLYLVSGSYDNSIRIYSIKERINILTISKAHEKPITRVKWLRRPPAGAQNKNEFYFISCGHDEVSILRKLNVKTLTVEVLNTFMGHNRSVNCVDCNDDLIATGSFDKTLRLWSLSDEDDSNDITREYDESVENGTNVEKQNKKKQKVKSSEKSVSKERKSALMTLTGHTESITGVKWLGSCNEFNSVATSSMDRSICIWDVEVGECKRRVLSAIPLLGFDYSNESNLFLAASCDRHVRIWDARAPDNATAKTAYTSHNAWVSSVSFCSSEGGNRNPNNFISGGYDNLVKLWDLRSPKACLYDMIGHHDKVLDVNWSNPSYVFSGSVDSTIKIFQM